MTVQELRWFFVSVSNIQITKFGFHTCHDWEGSATYVGVASPSTLRDFLAGFLVVAWPPRRSAGGRT